MIKTADMLCTISFLDANLKDVSVRELLIQSPNYVHCLVVSSMLVAGHSTLTHMSKPRFALGIAVLIKDILKQPLEGHKPRNRSGTETRSSELCSFPHIHKL